MGTSRRISRLHGVNLEFIGIHTLNDGVCVVLSNAITSYGIKFDLNLSSAYFSFVRSIFGFLCTWLSHVYVLRQDVKRRRREGLLLLRASQQKFVGGEYRATSYMC